ncbi:MAG: hypothetical protein AAGC92_11940 [Pseudomonadota bacterium]
MPKDYGLAAPDNPILTFESKAHNSIDKRFRAIRIAHPTDAARLSVRAHSWA